MKPDILVKKLMAFFCCILFSSPVFAGLIQYNYSSGPLDWQSTFVAGYFYDDEYIYEDDGKISFQFSFSIDESLISASGPSTFYIKDSVVNPDVAFDYYPVLDMFHSSNGKFVINPDGSIQTWDLKFKIRVNKYYSDYLNNLEYHKIYITTKGGNRTCNCEHFQEWTNILTQRPYDTWIIASSLESIYTGDSSLDHWTIQKISVPEPGGLLLMSIGLLGFTALRKRISD